MSSEVLDDGEKQYWFSRIVDLLVAAGYFRARVTALDPFDRVVGGVAWCLSHAVSVDVSVEEGASIGQRIRISGALVDAMRGLNLPGEVQAHQIHGLDVQNLFLMVQGLVKLALQRRKNEQRFHREVALMDEKDTGSDHCSPIVRKWKRSWRAKSSREEVLGTLMEFGEIIDFRGETEQSCATDDREEIATNPKLELDGILNKFKADDKTASEIQCVGETPAEAEANRIANIERQLILETKRSAELAGKYKSLKAQYHELASEKSGIDAAIAELRRQTAEYDAMMKDPEQARQVSELKALIMQHEDLKSREAKFKKECKDEKTRLEQRIEFLENGGDPEERERFTKISTMLERDSGKHAKMKHVLSKVNLDLARVQRKLDDIPSRVELLEYQRRFTELSNFIAQTERETQKYYDKYNALCQTHELLKNQNSLLKSISDGFGGVKSTALQRQNLLHSLEEIVKGVNLSYTNLSEKLAKEEAAFVKANSAYSKLLETQRMYHRAVKDLQYQCLKNESLVENLSKTETN